MKTELRLRPHTIDPDRQVIELWYGDRFIGTVVGLDGTGGVRVLSKFPMRGVPVLIGPDGIGEAHVQIGAGE